MMDICPMCDDWRLRHEAFKLGVQAKFWNPKRTNKLLCPYDRETEGRQAVSWDKGWDFGEELMRTNPVLARTLAPKPAEPFTISEE